MKHRCIRATLPGNECQGFYENISPSFRLRVIYCHLSESVLTWHLAHCTRLVAHAVVLVTEQVAGGVTGFQILCGKSGWVS